MNTWKDRPELFTGGNFKFGVKGKAINLSLEMYFTVTNQFAFACLRNRIDINKCTLIARPISDMTDEEVRSINSGWKPEILRDSWTYQAKIGNLSFSTAEQMLSIGVYPFNQSHFETGDVIDSTKLKTNKDA